MLTYRCKCGVYPNILYIKGRTLITLNRDYVDYVTCHNCGLKRVVKLCYKDCYSFPTKDTYEWCPNCYSVNNYEVTCMGFKDGDPDPNRRSCERCGTTWYHPDYIKLMKERNK